MTKPQMTRRFETAREALECGAQFCYVVDEACTRTADGQLIPDVVFEHTEGRYPMSGNGGHAVPWAWGTDMEAAQVTARNQNKSLNHSEEDVSLIIASSLAVS